MTRTRPQTPSHSQAQKHTYPTLPADVLTWLSQDFSQSLEQNSTRFNQRRKEGRDVRKDWEHGFWVFGLRGMSAFEVGVRLLGVLEGAEEKALGKEAVSVEGKEFEELVTTALNAEFLILKLNAAIPLRYHPFLLHWVCASYRIQEELRRNRDLLGTEGFRGKELMLKARLLVVKRALMGPDVLTGTKEWGTRHMGYLSPKTITEKVAMMREVDGVDLRGFVRMLVEEGVPLPVELGALQENAEKEMLLERALKGAPAYLPAITAEDNEAPFEDEYITAPNTAPISASNTPPPPAAPAPALLPSSNKKPVHTPTTALNIRGLQSHLLTSPQSAISTLTRLPLDIASLDLLTNLLASGTLANADVNEVSVVREFVEYCLRGIERMGASGVPGGVGLNFEVEGSSVGSSSSSRPASMSDDIEDFLNLQSSSLTPPLPLGAAGAGDRDSQIRAVKLIVLFLSNLFRKGLVPVQELFFQIEEICVRYLWVREVREFKAWLEGAVGDMGDEDADGEGGVGLGIAVGVGG